MVRKGNGFYGILGHDPFKELKKKPAVNMVCVCVSKRKKVSVCTFFERSYTKTLGCIFDSPIDIITESVYTISHTQMLAGKKYELTNIIFSEYFIIFSQLFVTDIRITL